MRQQRHRDALTRGEQHVHLAAAGMLGHVVGETDEIVGGLAHRGDDDHDVVAGAAGAHDVIGDGPDAVGIGHRCAAELLHDHDGSLASPTKAPLRPHGKPTASQATGALTRPGRVSAPGTFFGRCRVPTSVSERRKTRRVAREAARGGEKRRRRLRIARTIGIVAVIFVAGIAAHQRLQGGGSKQGRLVDDHHAREHYADHHRGHGRVPGRVHGHGTRQGEAEAYKAAPPMTIDTAKTYVAHDRRPLAERSTSRSTRRTRRRRRTASCSSPSSTSTTG